MKTYKTLLELNALLKSDLTFLKVAFSEDLGACLLTLKLVLQFQSRNFEFVLL